MPNLLAAFRNLFPQPPLLVGEVLTHNADGTSTLELPDGAQTRARGQAVAVGSKAFLRGGVVEGEAPNLPAYNAEV